MPIPLIDKLVAAFDGKYADANRVEVDASGFDGNLSTSDTDVQLVAQALDDLTVTGGSAPITQIQSHTATGVQNYGSELAGRLHILASTVTAFDLLSGATWADDGQFAIHNGSSSAVEFDVSAVTLSFDSTVSSDAQAYDIPADATVLFYISGDTLYKLADADVGGTTGTMGDHPVVLTRNTPGLSDLNSLAQESLNDNSGLWIVASDQDSTFEGTVDASIMIRSLRSGILDADGGTISTTAVQKSTVRLAGGTVVRIFSQTDLRVVSGPLMAAGSRYPDVIVTTGPINLVGNQVLYNIYRNHTAVADLNLGQTLEFRLPSLQNAIDLAYLNRNDVFCFRNDGTNGTFRIRTFQVGTVFSDGSQSIDVLPGRTLCITPAASGAVWTILQFGQSSDISTETISVNMDWYRDGADATAADNSVRLHHRQEVVSGIVRDHVIAEESGWTSNPIALRFQHRNIQDDIAWVQWWSTWDTNVPALGTMVEEIKANVVTALSYIESNINNGFDFDFAAPDSVNTVQSIGHVSGNEVRYVLHTGHLSSSYSVNHPIRIQGAANAVHNGVFELDSIGSDGANVTLHVTNPAVTDGTQDEPSTSAYAQVEVYADAVLVSHDLRQVNFNLYQYAARTDPWVSINDGWFNPGNTDAASVLAIGYNTDIETTGSVIAVQDDAGDWFSVKGGPRNDITLVDNRTTYTSSGLNMPVNYPVLNIDTLGINVFYIPEYPNQLGTGESRTYRLHSYEGNDTNDVSVAVGAPGVGNFVVSDEGLNAIDLLPGTGQTIELYNDGTESGWRIIGPVSKSVPAFPSFTTPESANTAQINPLPISVFLVIAAQNEDQRRRFFDVGSTNTNKLTLQADADYVFDGSVDVLFNGTEGTGLLFVPVTLMPVIGGSDQEEFAHTVSLIFSRNGQSGSGAPKFSHTLRIRFEWQGSVNDEVEFQLRFGTFPSGYSNADIQVQNWKWTATAQLNLN